MSGATGHSTGTQSVRLSPGAVGSVGTLGGLVASLVSNYSSSSSAGSNSMGRTPYSLPPRSLPRGSR